MDIFFLLNHAKTTQLTNTRMSLGRSSLRPFNKYVPICEQIMSADLKTPFSKNMRVGY